MATIEIYMLGRFMILSNGTDIVPKLGNSKKKLAISLAIFTAPYLFFLPTMCFY